ncbi:hypothetical protein [Leptotrichia trevisanii]|uniref:hypothetical protein n=1 Tax=Leptotrichia trevisanii TaxID=109328 RepID=UPI0004223FA6|nr:hypothetical protein [Leptotrichia trevisanii]
MKKLLFVLMLAVMGNTFAAPKTQKGRSMRTTTTSRISESEKKEIENAVQVGMQPFMNTVRNAMLTEINKQSSKIPIDSLFPKEYVISDAARKEIGKKYTDEIIKIVINGMKPRIAVKKINYISQDEVQVNCDMKVKNLDKVWDLLDFDEKMERQFLTKIGLKDMDAAEKIMRNKGNEELKKKYYYVMLEEVVNFLNEEIRKTKEEENLVEDISVTVKKVNGRWQVDLNQ